MGECFRTYLYGESSGARTLGQQRPGKLVQAAGMRAETCRTPHFRLQEYVLRINLEPPMREFLF